MKDGWILDTSCMAPGSEPAFFCVGLRVSVLGLEQFRVQGLGVAGLGLRAQG